MAEEAIVAPLVEEAFAPVAEATVAEGLGGYAGLDALAGGATMAGTGAADAGLGLAATEGAAGAGALDAGLTQLASGGTAGGALEGSSVAGGAGATGAGAVAPAATAAPAATSATLATGGGAGTPLAEGADVVAAGAPQTAATATLPATTPVETAGAGSVDAGGASATGGAAQSPYSLASQTTPNALPGYSTTPQLNAIGGDVASTTGTGLQAGATQPATGGNWLSKGLNALSSIKPTTALTGAGLALNGYSQYKANKAMGDMQQQIKNAVQPLTGTQSNLLNQYNSGQLNASDAATINNYVTSQTAQIKQQYAAMGQGGSPQEQQAIAAVQQQAQAMQAQALQNYLTSALQTTNAITGPYATLSQQQIAQDTALQGAAGNVFKAIAAQQSGQPATS